MNSIPQILKDIRTWACLLLLIIMGRQQLITFAEYKDKFSDPVQFTEQTYGKDDITAYGIRLAEVKSFLKKPTTLSYVGEPVVPNNGTREMHYALTQYSLAPNVLLRNASARDHVTFNNGASPPTLSDRVCDTVLYNLYSSGHIDPATNYHLNNGWHIAKDFNNGIIVLTR